MNTTVYLLLVVLHILAAVALIGGMIFIAAVLVPYARRIKDRDAASDMLLTTGRLFKRVGHSAVGLLILTGFGLLPARGIPHKELFNAELWKAHPSAQIIGLKFILLLVVVGLGVYHDNVVGRRAAELMRTAPDSPAAARARCAASWLGRISLLIAVVILVLAAMLVRGYQLCG